MSEKDNVIIQAQAQAQEARTQHSIIIGILRELDLPLRDWEAHTNIIGLVQQLQSQKAELVEALEKTTRELSTYFGSSKLDALVKENEELLAKLKGGE